MSSHLRHDPFHDHWVTFCPDRLNRPHAFAKSEAPSFRQNPFAPGMESETPAEVEALRPENSPPNSPDWSLRVIPNRYPAFTSATTPPPPAPSPYESRPARGGHEVIIETADPHQKFCEFSELQMKQLVRIWQQRVRHWSQIPGVEALQLFKNSGAPAGASLPHPHSQLVALPLVPTRLARLLATLTAPPPTPSDSPPDLIQDLIQLEIQTATRVVLESDSWIVLCPYASRFPYEMQLFPLIPWPDYGHIPTSGLEDLAQVLRKISYALDAVLPHAPFNLVLHTIPPHATLQERQAFRCHFELFPRIAGIAGFELGSGMWMNSILPEVAASRLREKLNPA